jgi:hypothetical protein
LNTALEIVEEVTSRCTTYTQDLEYAKCYGQLHSRIQQQQQQYGQQQQQQYGQQQQHQYEDHAEFATSAGTVYGYGYDYDYSECADPLNNEVESTHQMLSYFDQKQQQLYHQQKCQQEQQQEQQEQEQQQQEDKSETVGLNLDTVDVVYYEEGVIVEGANGEGVNGEQCEKKEEFATNTAATKATSESEDAENKKKRGGWLSSWF